jgi:hypothetical protein
MEGGLDHHLAGELHPGGGQVQAEDRLAPEGAQPAVEVPDPAVEEEPAEPAQQGIADDPVAPGHGRWLDAAPKAIAHDQVVSLAELLDQSWDGSEVVALIGVDDDDVLAPGCLDASTQGAAIATLRDLDDAGVAVPGDLDRAVGAPVVGDDDLTAESGGSEASLGDVNARGQGLGLVETGQDDRDVDGAPRNPRSGCARRPRRDRGLRSAIRHALALLVAAANSTGTAGPDWILGQLTTAQQGTSRIVTAPSSKGGRDCRVRTHCGYPG